MEEKVYCNVCKKLLFINYTPTVMEIKCPRCKAIFYVKVDEKSTNLTMLKTPTNKFLKTLNKITI